jgi:hypothetical protein
MQQACYEPRHTGSVATRSQRLHSELTDCFYYRGLTELATQQPQNPEGYAFGFWHMTEWAGIVRDQC